VRRLIIVGAVVAVAIVAVAIAAVVRSNGGGDKTVQTVGGHRITQNDLDLTVEHFHEEADREGKPFPAKGSDEYRRVEKIALGLLIDRAAIEAAAARIGVQVTQAQVDARAAGTASGESEGGGDIRVAAEAAFGRGTARTQLLTEAVSRKLTSNVRVRATDVRAYYRTHRGLYATTPFARVAAAIRSELLSARKNAVLARWLAGVRSREPAPRLQE
jgi:hypothetical protein